jgi:anti-sigma factor RsiW
MAAHCDEIGLMLGPFEDGELEPHEMQEVARHLAVCLACEKLLDDYNLIGRELRAGMASQPPLEGLAQAVAVRIKGVKRPLATRIARWMGEGADRMRSPIGLGSLAAVAAALTILVVTPYARDHFAHRALTAPHQVLAVSRTVNPAPEARQLVAKASLPNAGQGSPAVISRLETATPSVAMWSDPRNDTTVIWLPEGKQ